MEKIISWDGKDIGENGEGTEKLVQHYAKLMCGLPEHTQGQHEDDMWFLFGSESKNRHDSFFLKCVHRNCEF